MSEYPSQYEADFYQWSLEQARLLRSGDWKAVDVEHLAEEIEDMGKGVRREWESRLKVLIVHLLKWAFQTELRGVSCQLTIQEQRDKLHELLADNPSLKNQMTASLERTYPRAVKRTALETSLIEENFPTECPFRLEDILNESFWPN
ncbi:MAG: DUF29 domain-containing protein [bacterium]